MVSSFLSLDSLGGTTEIYILQMLEVTAMMGWFRVILLTLSVSAGAYAHPKHILMFSADWDIDAVNAVAKNLSENDFLGLTANTRLRGGERLVAGHTFSIPARLDSVAKRAAQSCPMAGRKEAIIYDPEHWTQTPQEEQKNLRESIARASQIVHKKGCFEFGLAPDQQFAGVDPSKCSGEISSLLDQVAWKNVDIFIVQAQGLLSRRCGGAANTQAYAKFVKDWASELKKRNPEIKIISAISFSHTDPELMTTIVEMMKPTVNGFYIAYPKARSGTCRYCKPENLEKVMKVIKTSD